MEDIGRLIREARTRQGLTQRELARRSGVPQPTLSQVEGGRRSPTVALLARIIDGGRLPLEIRPVEEPAASAAATARRVARRLRTGHRDAGSREDSALRQVIDLREALIRAAPDGIYELVADRPPLSGDPGWDAFVAGVVEEACVASNVVVPTWTQEPERFVSPFWYLSSTPYHDWERTTAPAALVRHGVLAAAGELASV